MNYQERKRAITVGGFIAVGLLIFIVAVLALGGNQKRFVSSITLHTNFANISGLKLGNNVTFSGVKIGLVKNIEIISAEKVRITFDIEKKASHFIHKDAKITIGSESFIGNKTLTISAGSPAVPLVQENDEIQSELPFSTENIMKTFQKNNENLVDITENLKLMTQAIVEGKGTIGTLLSDSSMAQNFKKIVENASNASMQASELTAELKHFSASLNQPNSSINQIMKDTSMYPHLQGAINQLSKSVADVNTMTQKAKEASEQLSNKNTPLGALLNDEQSGAEMKTILQNLKSSSEKLDENMEALQHNFLFRGYFRKKAKEEANTTKK